MMGIKADECYSETELDLKAGDRVVIYNDGVTEAVSLRTEPMRRHHTAGDRCREQQLGPER